MTELQLSREEQLVAFFVNACTDTKLGHTRLMKLLYLADYEARRYLGRPISNIPYIWYDHGPFDPDFYSWLERLKKENVIREERLTFASGKKAYHLTPGDVFPTHGFGPAEIEILSFVCREYSKVELRELLDDVVYQTEPMLKAKEENAHGERLDMDIVNDAKSKQFGMAYEELLARSQEARAGKVIPHAAAMREVHAALTDAAA